jgi:hypothetical protein
VSDHVHEKIFSGEKHCMPGCWFWVCATCPEFGHTGLDFDKPPAQPKIEVVRYWTRVMEQDPRSAPYAKRRIHWFHTGRHLRLDQPLPEEIP